MHRAQGSRVVGIVKLYPDNLIFYSWDLKPFESETLTAFRRMGIMVSREVILCANW